jgi:hypothetical protein
MRLSSYLTTTASGNRKKNAGYGHWRLMDLLYPAKSWMKIRSIVLNTRIAGPRNGNITYPSYKALDLMTNHSLRSNLKKALVTGGIFANYEYPRVIKGGKRW